MSEIAGNCQYTKTESTDPETILNVVLTLSFLFPHGAVFFTPD